jgi:hypothetical protein
LPTRPHEPSLHAPFPQDELPQPQSLDATPQLPVEHPPRVLWWRHPVLIISIPAIDPSKSQRFIPNPSIQYELGAEHKRLDT